MAARPPRSGGDGGPERIGPMLTRLRLARGLSQLHLAERLCAAAATPTVTRHEVSRWEREERVPGQFWLTWLAVVLEAPLDRLEAAVAGADRHRPAPAADPAARLADYRRLWRPPTAGRLLTALDRGDPHHLHELAHAWLTGPPDPDDPLGASRPEEVLVPVRRWVDGGTLRDTLDAYETRLHLLRRQDDQVGGLDHATYVDRELRAAITILRSIRSRGPLRRRALRMIAGYAQLTGWTQADAGNDPAARRAYQVALHAAAAADDRALAVYVLASLSHQSLTAGDPQEALLLARTGSAGARASGTALAQALLLHRVALAAAVAGERRAAEAALVQADRAAARSEPADEPDWLYWLDRAELAALTGRCWATLGRPLRAVRLLAKPRPRGPGIGPRATAIYTVWLARSYLALGEIEQAAHVAKRALRGGVGAGSARAAAAVRHLHPLLLRHRDLRIVRQYELRAADAFDYLPGADQLGRGGGRRASV